MTLETFKLSVNDNKKPQIIKWSEDEEDYLVEGVEGLTRQELIEVVEEINRITEL
jgi:hypothetical protein